MKIFNRSNMLSIFKGYFFAFSALWASGIVVLRLDRGVGRDPAIGRPEAVAAFEPPAVALGVEVGGQVARSLRLPARASGSTRQQVLIPGDSLARTRTRA